MSYVLAVYVIVVLGIFLLISACHGDKRNES